MAPRSASENVLSVAHRYSREKIIMNNTTPFKREKNLGTLRLCSGELLFCVQELVKRNLLSLTVRLFLNSMGYLGVLCTLVRANM